MVISKAVLLKKKLYIYMTFKRQTIKSEPVFCCVHSGSNASTAFQNVTKRLEIVLNEILKFIIKCLGTPRRVANSLFCFANSASLWGGLEKAIVALSWGCRTEVLMFLLSYGECRSQPVEQAKAKFF